MGLHKVTAAVAAISLSVIAGGCGQQNANTKRAGEDQGMAPDTTATTPNMITPSDDATATSTAAAAVATPQVKQPE
jgi:hypothetical protein